MERSAQDFERFFIVEMAGIEPASEGISFHTSTSVVGLLDFAN